MNANDSAFPYDHRTRSDDNNRECGLTKREHIAALMMQAMALEFLSAPTIAATWAVRATDALIAELSKEKEGK